MTGSGAIMVNESGVGARAERTRRRKFWGVLGGLAIAGGITGFAWGFLGVNPDWRGAARAYPAVVYLIVGAEIIAFAYGSWVFFRNVDEVEVTDNLWASLVGLYVYSVLLPSWALLAYLEVAPEPSHWVIYAATLVSAGIVYSWLKLRRR